MITIGLFGTCGNSRWRGPFMARHRELGINYFNPQVENWEPSCAEEEARHLADDQIILFPITDETYGLGSLSEVGFSILQAIRLDDRREFIIMIDRNLLDVLSDQNLRKESFRARALVAQHLKKLRLPNLYLVDALSEMLEVSIQLYKSVKLREPLKRYNPHNKVASESLHAAWFAQRLLIFAGFDRKRLGEYT